VGQWRFLWNGFICLKLTRGDPCGLGQYAFSSGTVEISVGWVYLPPVHHWRPLWTGFSLPSQVGQWRFLWNGFICLKLTRGDTC
jgi:hypothetical protein